MNAWLKRFAGTSKFILYSDKIQADKLNKDILVWLNLKDVHETNRFLIQLYMEKKFVHLRNGLYIIRDDR